MAKKTKPVEEKQVADKVHEELKSVRGMLARALADYDNLSKRTERERVDFVKIASVNLMARLLPVLDNLERAQEHLKDSGLAIAIGEFKSVLKEEGFEEVKIKIRETEFSSINMEAIEAIDIDDEKLSGKIAELLSSGWVIKATNPEVVVRPAKVKVYNLKRINN